jgi:ribonuclease-3
MAIQWATDEHEGRGHVTGVDDSAVESLMAALGQRLDPALLRQALTHRSFAYENGGLPTNERLEFLGDSVLGLVVTERLYRDFPDEQEGQLAKLRAAVVNATALADVARALGLGGYLLLGKGEESTGGHDKSSILADAMEAVIGAMYMSTDLETTRAFIERIFGPLIASSAQLGAGLDWKTSLQERSAELERGVPEYRVTDTGPDHAKEFTAQAVIGGQVLGTGQGRSKKVAEQEAAAETYAALNESSSVDA